MDAPEAKRVRRCRDFNGATAIDKQRHYYVEWRDFEECLDFLANRRKWLLISGPFQSGKTSFACALADAAKSAGWVSFVTTLTVDMVAAANDWSSGAADVFFGLLAEAVEVNSGRVLKQRPGTQGGMTQVTRMLEKETSLYYEPDVIWFVDEAGLLNSIKKPEIIMAFLSGLRTAKEQSRSGGAYRLRSFSLVGTAKTQMLLVSARDERMRAASRDGVAYVSTASPGPLAHDSYSPFPPGLPIISPLSLEKNRASDLLRKEDIEDMLRRYARDHGVSFRKGTEISTEGPEVRAREHELVLGKLGRSIGELTSGYKGLVGSCCEYLQGNGICSLRRWKRDSRNGSLAAHVLNFRVYSRMVSNIPEYSEELKSVILDCVYSPTSGVPYLEKDWNLLLPAVNDGVLVLEGHSVFISSGLLLAAIVQDCDQATAQQVPVFDTFEGALWACFRYIKPERLSVLNANGQPSEYIWQSEFLLALKLVLDKGYRRYKYTILVECKRRNKQGQRLVRLVFYLRNTGAPPKGFEVQAKGGPKSIKDHISKADRYRLLFEACEMNYVYFTVGPDDQAKTVIERERKNYDQVKCWFVQYLQEDKVWNVELLKESGWQTVRLDVPSIYPEFKFAARPF